MRGIFLHNYNLELLNPVRVSMKFAIWLQFLKAISVSNIIIEISKLIFDF